MNIFKTILFGCLGILLTSCSDNQHDTQPTKSECDQLAIKDNDQFTNGPKDFITLETATITGDCLEITYAASGCSGDSWVLDLFDSGDVAESLPVQKFLRLSLKNEEACLAIFMKTITFDLNPVQLSNETQILLNIDGITDQILYEY